MLFKDEVPMVVKVAVNKKQSWAQNVFLHCMFFLVAFSAVAQQSQEEHESHHPDIYNQAMPVSQTSANTSSNNQKDTTNSEGNAAGMGPSMSPGMGPGLGNGMGPSMSPGMGPGIGDGMAKGMGIMMEKMGAPKPKDLYPSLMRLTLFSAEKKQEVLEKAIDRMLTGNQLMINGFTALAVADGRQDFSEMQSAITLIEQGLSQYDSGLAAKRAIAEDQEPRRVALSWFKNQMNLLPTSQGSDTPLIFGISPIHAGVMLILFFFIGAMLWMYGFKMRRAGALLKELESESPQSQLTPATRAANSENSLRNVIDNSTASPLAPEPPSSNAIQTTVSKKAVFSGNVKVIGIFSETHDVKTFRLAATDGSNLPFNYEPGQFVTFSLSIPNQAKVTKRSYTIASSPTERDYFEVTIKREEQGVVSRFMHDQVSVGDELTIKAPSGKFYFNGSGEDSVVLISGGVGITPMMSAVRYLTARCWEGNIYFLFCTRSSNDFIFERELQYLQARHKNLHVLVSMTRAEGTSWMGPQGRLTSQLISDFVPNLPAKTAHICGPPAMMEAMTQTLVTLGMAPARVKTEAFGSAPPKKKPSDIPESNKSSAQSGFEIRFAKSQKKAIAQQDETVLDVAEALDVEIESSCRSGTCGSCKIKLLEGVVDMDVDDGLEEDDKRQGYVLACQSIPKTSVVVEA
tara:strand:+ start:4879 stop:6933 length:2055 start_codon:yes stop_codon:yes gene_type:complete